MEEQQEHHTKFTSRPPHPHLLSLFSLIPIDIHILFLEYLQVLAQFHKIQGRGICTLGRGGGGQS